MDHIFDADAEAAPGHNPDVNYTMPSQAHVAFQVAHSFGGVFDLRYARLAGLLQDPQAEEKRIAVEKIDSAYKDGKPFFTKERFRDIEAKIEALDLREPDGIELEGVDGSLVRQNIVLPHEFRPEMFPLVTLRHYRNMIKAVVKDLPSGGKTALSSAFVEVTLDKPFLGDKDKVEEKDVAYWAGHFEAALSIWRANSDRRKLATILSNCPQLHKVTKIVCFGLGDFHRDLWHTDHGGSRAAIQHASVLTVASIIREKTGNEVPIFLQEPFYSGGVKQVLRSHGFIIYDGSCRSTRGYIDLDDSTLVVAIAPGCPVRAVVADTVRPPVMMCSGVLKGTPEQRLECWKYLGYHEEPMLVDYADDRVRDMLENDYDESSILGGGVYEENQVGPLRNVFVYTRKDSVGTKEGGVVDHYEGGLEVERGGTLEYQSAMCGLSCVVS